MTLGDIATKARSLTNTDTSSYTDANLLIDINIWYQKVVSMILESADDQDFDDARKTDYPIKTIPFSAAIRDYSIPVSEKVLKIKRVDVSWDGGTTFYRSTPIDDGEIDYGLGNDAQTDANFIQQVPRHDIKYNSIFIYPMPSATDVANGAKMRVEWERQVTPFAVSDYTSVLTDSTVVPGFDDPFHPMLAYGGAAEYSLTRSLPQLSAIASALQDWELRLRTHYGRKDLDRQLALSPAYISYR